MVSGIISSFIEFLWKALRASTLFGNNQHSVVALNTSPITLIFFLFIFIFIGAMVVQIIHGLGIKDHIRLIISKKIIDVYINAIAILLMIVAVFTKNYVISFMLIGFSIGLILRQYIASKKFIIYRINKIYI